MAMTLGLRQGEVVTLTWAEVDLESCRLTVSGTLTWVEGKPYVGPPKSEAGRRTISIPEQLAATLTVWRDRQDLERLDADDRWLDNDLVFAAADGRPRRGDVLTHRFRSLTDMLRLPPIRYHDLRRFAAVLMLSGSGGDAFAAGAALGHSRKSRLAADLYGYLPPELARRLAAGAEAALWTGESSAEYPPEAPREVVRSSDRSSRHLLNAHEPLN